MAHNISRWTALGLVAAVGCTYGRFDTDMGDRSMGLGGSAAQSAASAAGTLEGEGTTGGIPGAESSGGITVGGNNTGDAGVLGDPTESSGFAGAAGIAGRSSDGGMAGSAGMVDWAGMAGSPEMGDCGDGHVWVNHEQCDDGNNDNTDSCLNSCEHASCGDGYVWHGVEDCDDGGTTPGDGCDELCQTEECGNGKLENDEECDDNNNVSGDGCSAQCTQEDCGNGRLDIDEECDDNNNSPNDGCDRFCQVELCGNGIINGHVILADGFEYPDGLGFGGAGGAGGAVQSNELIAWHETERNWHEACDDGDADNHDNCIIDPINGHMCQFNVCGDGYLDQEDSDGDGPDTTEECDPGGAVDTEGCTRYCKLSFCGDGYVNAAEPAVDSNGEPVRDEFGEPLTEQCDPGGGTVANPRATETDYCDSDCTIPKCGDGDVNYTAGEECDPGSTDASDWGWCNPPGATGNNSVSIECLNNVCGDGYINENAWWPARGSGEECDDGEPNDGGSATCNPSGATAANGSFVACLTTRCGDGYRNPLSSEQCDDGNDNNHDNCIIDPGAGHECLPNVCGDGYLDADSSGDGVTEECDCGSSGSSSCNPPGALGTNGVPVECQDTECGDGYRNPLSSEQCDDGNDNNHDNCIIDPGGGLLCIWNVCGDGYLDEDGSDGVTEECDDGNNVSGDGCSAVCEIEP